MLGLTTNPLVYTLFILQVHPLDIQKKFYLQDMSQHIMSAVLMHPFLTLIGELKRKRCISPPHQVKARI